VNKDEYIGLFGHLAVDAMPCLRWQIDVYFTFV